MRLLGGSRGAPPVIGRVLVTVTIGCVPDRLYFTDSDQANALIAADPMA